MFSAKVVGFQMISLISSGWHVTKVKSRSHWFF